MKLLNKIFITLNYLILFSMPKIVGAQVSADLINAAAGPQGAQYPTSAGAENAVPQTIGRLISIVLSFVGALFFIYIVVAGIEWMTAGGAEEQVTKAKTKMKNAIIGLAVTVGAYFITYFISNTLGATGGV
ncbi:MAG: pilin [Patescibacteria group bacterium]|jgi:hypothetical protein